MVIDDDEPAAAPHAAPRRLEAQKRAVAEARLLGPASGEAVDEVIVESELVWIGAGLSIAALLAIAAHAGSRWLPRRLAQGEGLLPDLDRGQARETLRQRCQFLTWNLCVRSVKLWAAFSDEDELTYDIPLSMVHRVGLSFSLQTTDTWPVRAHLRSHVVCLS